VSLILMITTTILTSIELEHILKQLNATRFIDFILYNIQCSDTYLPPSIYCSCFSSNGDFDTQIDHLANKNQNPVVTSQIIDNSIRSLIFTQSIPVIAEYSEPSLRFETGGVLTITVDTKGISISIISEGNSFDIENKSELISKINMIFNTLVQSIK
jgi:hypothetical protein